VGNLTSYQTAQEASNAIANLRAIGGPTVNYIDVITNATALFDSSGNRPNVRDVLFIFSSAAALCPSNTACRPASDLILRDVTIITMAMGFEGPPPTIQLGSSCNNLNNLDHVPQKILNALCQANCYCPAHYEQFVSSDVMCQKFAECVLSGPNGRGTWTGAQRTCQQTSEGLKGFLVDSFSSEKEAFIKTLAITNNALPFWIGLNDQANPGTYVWDRGTDPSVPKFPSDYQNFAPSMPNNAGGQNCLMSDKVNSGFKTGWSNSKCNDIFGNDGVKNIFCQTNAYDTDNPPAVL
jgi:hypothetical protein